MIRIKRWDERGAEGIALRNHYLFMIARALPFLPEDILYDIPNPNKPGECWTNEDFWDSTQKGALHWNKLRKEKLTAISEDEILKQKIKEDDKKYDKLFNDALIAQKILQRCANPIYQYLYDTAGNLNRENLRSFLLMRMDSIPEVLKIGMEENDICEVFCYDSFCLKNKNRIPPFLDLLGVDVCPYCNRSFVTNVIPNADKKGISRRQAEFDHFLPKSQYPQFALCLNNLIPVCSSCNHWKKDKEGEILYPYAEELPSECHFTAKTQTGYSYLIGTEGSGNEFEVQMDLSECSDAEMRKRAENAFGEVLGLNELYRTSHNHYLLQVFKQRYVMSDEYLDSLVDSIPELLPDREALKEMLYLKSIRQDDFGNAPLARLTHDIDEEITKWKKLGDA